MIMMIIIIAIIFTTNDRPCVTMADQISTSTTSNDSSTNIDIDLSRKVTSPVLDASNINSEAELVSKDKSEAELLSLIEREGKEFDKDAEIDRIMSTFKLNYYAVLDLQPGIPDSDIKKTYRTKSLLIHPDKTSNPRAPEAFDRLAKAQQQLLDEGARSKLDESISDARMLLMREFGYTIDSEQVKDPDDDFLKAWRTKTTEVIMDNERRRQRQEKAQMQEQGRQQRKEEEEQETRKKQKEHDRKWEASRDDRIGSWRSFQKTSVGVPKMSDKAGVKKRPKVKTLG